MNWNKLETEEGLDQLIELSNQQAVMIFKHSTRCSISSMALSRLERSWTEENSAKVTPYYLDLIANRSVSNKIAETLHVMHESPQVIVLKGGRSVYNASHMSINSSDIVNAI